MMGKIKIGSRKSKLALWQAEAVAALLNQQGLKTRIITMETRGDKILDTPIAKIGSKGVFTEEIEAMLKNGEVDLAVHSAKDMPSKLPPGFSLIAFTEREKPNDVLVSADPSISLQTSDKPLCIGTSSVRRVALLKHFYPHVKTVNIRGNLQTRIKKMESGDCDALMLAYAGVKRMGYEHLIAAELPVTEFVPPVGQGSMAIEVFDSIDENLKQKIRQSVNHPETEMILTAERAFLRKLEGGCSIPAFALAQCEKNMIRLTAGLTSLDGKRVIKKMVTGEKENARQLGEDVGFQILENGGRELLAEIRAAQE